MIQDGFTLKYLDNGKKKPYYEKKVRNYLTFYCALPIIKVEVVI